MPAPIPLALAPHKLGKPIRIFRYLDASGAPIGAVARFDLPDGGKEVLPLTCWDDGGGARWRWQSWPEPRPLYGLDWLAAAPGLRQCCWWRARRLPRPPRIYFLTISQLHLLGAPRPPPRPIGRHWRAAPSRYGPMLICPGAATPPRLRSSFDRRAQRRSQLLVSRRNGPKPGIWQTICPPAFHTPRSSSHARPRKTDANGRRSATVAPGPARTRAISD